MDSLFFWLICLAAGMPVLAGSVLMELSMKKRWGRAYRKINCILPVLVYAALWLRFGCSMETVKGIVLMLLLLYAANSDLASHEVDDFLPVMIAVAAMIGVTVEQIPVMAAHGLLVLSVQLLILWLRPRGYGGADIKITAACAVAVGLYKGLFVICAGLSAALVHTLLRERKDWRTKAIPCIPYFAASAMLAYLL